ncbi:MAG TPA: polysaccharide pyruvyl transferase family protein [Acidimicrobiales bacterium]
MTVRIATTGAAYSANKGAASMLQALFDELPARWGDVEIAVLSTYPEADTDALRRAGRADARAVSATPLELVASHLPLAVMAAVLRRVGLPWAWLCRPPALRAIRRADLVVDVSGISYSSSRRWRFTIYGALVNLVPMLLGTPQVKASQALGPFDDPVTRILATTLLPRLDGVVARGEASVAHLEPLLPGRVVTADDLAFLMHLNPATKARAAALLDGRSGLVGVAPSAVVDGLCAERGIDYVGTLASFIDGLPGDGPGVVLFAHSTSASPLPRRLDDVPVCRAIAARLERPERCLLLDQDLLPFELRAVIERCSVLVTSRFHAMVSALAVGTPPLVVGWSHKYAEVLEQFGLESSMVDYAGLDGAELVRLYSTIADDEQALRRRILEHLPAVRSSAERNLDEIGRVLALTEASA